MMAFKGKVVQKVTSIILQGSVNSTLKMEN